MNNKEGTATAKWGTRPVPSPTPFSVTVKLECWDYAAYGVIQAELQKRISFQYRTQRWSTSHTIPLDKYPLFGANKIADAWERLNGAWYGYTNTFQDCDSGGTKIDPNTQNEIKHGQNNGDGFSVHEEYRGFQIQGSHTRLDPREKDLFIYSSIGPTFHDVTYDYVDQSDIGDTRSLEPEIKVHQIGLYEASSHVVNFTRKGVNNKGAQYWTMVQLARNRNVAYYGSTPVAKQLHLGTSGQANIFIENIDRDFAIIADARKVFDTTIAHEVGHSVGLDHHDAHDGLPAVAPERETCVMIGGGFTRHMMLEWQGSGFADFHDENIHPTGTGVLDRDWNDHWGQYKLHNHHGKHCSYSKGQWWWRNL